MTDQPQPTGITRRRLLRGGAAATALGAASLALPPNVRKAVADNPGDGSGHGSLRDIKHVVLLMQENRSFDHYFGTLAGVRGFDDPAAMRLPNGRSVFYQPDPSNSDGYLLPYHLDSLSTSAQASPSLSHAWKVQHASWNGGAMDNWVPAHIDANGATEGPFTMGYFTRADIPFHYALADAFTICDNYHCGVMGPTHPNRYMWMTGTIDPNGAAGGPALDNNAPKGTFSWITYPEQLEAAGVSWKFYHEPGPVTGLAPIQKMKQFQNLPAGSPLTVKGLNESPVGQFEYDAMNDRLPTVSWIMPPDVANEHPVNTPAAGAAFIASKIDALAANPEVWAKTAFILSYDENDGIFDHVLPPTPPPGTPDEFVTLTSASGTAGGGLPIGLGFRVPCVIVSPWTVGGFVASQVFDHTSQLKFLEEVTGVRAANISDWRRATVGDLTSAFRFDDFKKPPTLPDTQGSYNLTQYAVAELPAPTPPTSNQTLPGQERGGRPHTS